MKMWSSNVMILLLFCNACLSTGHGRVRFESKNFYNVLRWDPVKPAFPEQKVLYTVEYLSDAQEQKFKIKKECHNITVLFCDLTEETPSRHDVYYTAKVSVNGSSIGLTNRFRPLAETVFGPPILSTHTTASTLYVDVSLPTGPKGVPISDIIAQSKNGIHRTIPLYTLHITSPEWAALEIESHREQFVINIKNNQTEYCGFVVYRPSADWGRTESEKTSFCVMQDNARIPWQVLFLGVLGVVVVITSVVCACRHVKGGKTKNIPQALKIPFGTQKVPQFQDKNLIISKITEGSQTDQITYAKIQATTNVSSTGSGGYSPQDILCQAWQDSSGSSVGSGAHTTTPHVGDTSAQSSDIYGAVAIHVPAEEQEDCQQATTEHRETSQPGTASGESWDKGRERPQLTLCKVPPPPDGDPNDSHSAGPLLLNTVRDNKGQLALPLLSFQFQSAAGDTASPLIPDSKPHLSDLIDSMEEPLLQRLDSSGWSDSGCDDCSVNTPTHLYCNSHYHPSQPDFHQVFPGSQHNNAVLESGYKQNGMPAILCGHGTTDSCEYRGTNSPWNRTASEIEEESKEGEEDESRGEEEKSNQIVLGKWVVQISE